MTGLKKLLALTMILICGVLGGQNLEEKSGILKKWILLGPVQTDKSEQAENILREQMIQSSPDFALSSLKIKEYKNSDALVDLGKLYSKDKNISVYAFAEFELSAEFNGYIASGSDDYIKIWLNGKEVFSLKKARASIPDEDMIPVTFSKGLNRILVKTDNIGGDYAFCIRILSSNKLVENYSSTLQPERGNLPLDKRINDLSYKYLIKEPAFPRSGKAKVKNAIISSIIPAAIGFFPDYFNGTSMPVPDLLEWRCPIYTFNNPDGSINPAPLNNAIKAAKEAGIPEVQISMINSSQRELIDGVDSKDIDAFYTQYFKGRLPEKMSDSTGVSVTVPPDTSECRNNRFQYTHHDKDNQAFVKKVIADITGYYAENPEGELISTWHFRGPGNNDWWYPINDRFYDYSPSANAALCEFLKKKYTRLENLNRIYGTSYQDWKEIKAPDAQFGKVNISIPWQDFQEFRTKCIVDIQRGFYNEMRKYDKKRNMTSWMTSAVSTASRDGIILDYASQLNRECPGMLVALTWFDFYELPGELSGQLSLQYNVKTAIEPGRCTMGSYLKTYYNCLRFPVQKINWLYSIAAKPSQHPWIIWVMNQRGVLDELSEAELVQEPVANMFSYSDVLLELKPRLWSHEILDSQLRLFRALQSRNYNLPMFTDYTIESDLHKYKTVILADTKLIRPEMIAKLSRFVKDGGRLIIIGDCAGADLERAEAAYPLFSSLGISPNTVKNTSMEQDCGKGKLIFRHSLNSLLEDGKLTPEAEKMLSDAGCTRPLKSSSDGISSFIKKKGDSYYLGFINTKNGADSASFEFSLSADGKREGTEMISGEKVSFDNGRFSLHFSFQWEIKVIKLSR